MAVIESKSTSGFGFSDGIRLCENLFAHLI